jgi:hypothetical protein
MGAHLSAGKRQICTPPTENDYGKALTEGTRATNALENMSVLSPHFHKVFNTRHTTDPSLLEHVLQQ